MSTPINFTIGITNGTVTVNVASGVPGVPGPTGATGTLTSIVATVYANSIAASFHNNGGPGDYFTSLTGGPFVFDGYTVALGDTVLINRGSSSIVNGVYVCTNDGSVTNAVLTRDTRMQTQSQFQNTLVIIGPSGTTYSYSTWLCSTSGTIVVSSTAVSFKQLNGTTQISAGSGITISGNTISSSGGSGDLNYVYNQSTSASVWTINHNLNKYPSVTVQDSAGDTVRGILAYTSLNTVTLTFSAAFTGIAYLN